MSKAIHGTNSKAAPLSIGARRAIVEANRQPSTCDACGADLTYGSGLTYAFLQTQRGHFCSLECCSGAST